MIRAVILALLTATPLCAQEAVHSYGPAAAPLQLRLRTTTDLAVFGPTVDAFTRANPGIAVVYEQWGSNDLYALTAEECATGTPSADIVISSGVHQMVKLVNDGCAAPWQSPNTAALPAARRWRDEIWGISLEPAVMVYNRDLVPESEVPQTRFDLLDLLRPEGSAYAGRVATYDIAASGLGYLFAFMDAQEASTFGALMEAFARTGAIATCCSAEIIAGVTAGEYLIAYNVLGSYAEAAAAIEPSLGIVAPHDYTLILSRAAILPGDDARPEAGAFLDFVLSPAGQLTMAAQHLVENGADPDESPQIAPQRGLRRQIPLSPTLLVAMDRAGSARFIARWQSAFGRH